MAIIDSASESSSSSMKRRSDLQPETGEECWVSAVSRPRPIKTHRESIPVPTEEVSSAMDLKMSVAEEYSRKIDGNEQARDCETDDGECRTPTSLESKIPTILKCPGAPRKPKPKPRKLQVQSQRAIFTITEELLRSPPDLDCFIMELCKNSQWNKRLKIEASQSACHHLFL